MGEVLRALLDKSCIDSNPAWYTLTVNNVTITNTGVRTFALRDAFLQCKADTYFLAQGWAWLGAQAVGGNTAFPLGPAMSGFSMRNERTGRQYQSSGIIPKAVQNLNANNFLTLAHYVLFEPGDVIGSTLQVGVTDTFAGTGFYAVILAGIEYKMPGGKGFNFDGL